MKENVSGYFFLNTVYFTYFTDYRTDEASSLVKCIRRYV